MRRHAALQDLSRDHFFLLVHAQRIRKAAAGELAGTSLEAAARSLVRHWDREGARHLEEEETVIFPLLERADDATLGELVARAKQDHEWLRTAITRLKEKGADDVAELARRLHRHVRMEEDELFQRAQTVMDEAALEELRAASRNHRLTTRGAGSIGPRQDSCEVA